MKKTMAFLLSFSLAAMQCCDVVNTGTDSDNESGQEETVPAGDRSFALGADVGWLSQMENENCTFHYADGTAGDCLEILGSYGINTIRLRVWVDPEGGWCGKEDVVRMARRASRLGMRIMIDFHYSDTWADPGRQDKPAAWKELGFAELGTAVANHTSEVLRSLKENGVAPEWIQIGNETSNGMLWPDGSIGSDGGGGFRNYVTLSNAGYDAAKSVFPDATVLIHVNNGWDTSQLNWFLSGLKQYGASFDMIGLSLYPERENWRQYDEKIISNINKFGPLYSTEFIICEVGMEWTGPDVCCQFLKDIIDRSRTGTDLCHGVIYWEPEGYHAWSGYSKAAFDNSGTPTGAMDAFK